MLVSRVTQKDLEAAARSAGVALLELRAVRDRKNAYRFRLIPTRDARAYVSIVGVGARYKWERFSASPFPNKDGTRRRVHAVCWHGQRAFMRALYARAPEARIATSFITYTSIENFEATHAATASKQVGAPIAPIAYAELCRHGYGRAAGSEPETNKIDAAYFATLYTRETEQDRKGYTDTQDRKAYTS